MTKTEIEIDLEYPAYIAGRPPIGRVTVEARLTPKQIVCGKLVRKHHDGDPIYAARVRRFRLVDGRLLGADWMSRSWQLAGGWREKIGRDGGA